LEAVSGNCNEWQNNNIDKGFKCYNMKTEIDASKQVGVLSTVLCLYE